MKGTRNKLIFGILAIALVVALVFVGCARPAPAPEVPAPAPPAPAPPAPAPPTPAPPPAPTPPPVEEEWPWVVVDEWRIPAFSMVTGPLSFWGQMSFWCRDYAVEQINAAGGIAGRPIVLEKHDDECEPTKAAAEFTKVVPWALASIGPICDCAVHGAMPIAVREGIYVFVNDTGTDVALEYQPWCYHAMDLDERTYPPLVKAWLKRNPEITKVASFVSSEHAMWCAVTEIAEEAMHEAGVETTDWVEIPDGTVDFGPPAVKALASGADGFWFAAHPHFIAKTVLELQKRGFTDNDNILLFPHCENPDLWEIGHDRLDGIYAAFYFDLGSPAPRWQAFVKWLKEEHDQEPLFFNGDHIDEVYLLKAAIEDCKITGDPAKLKEERIKIRDYCNNVKDSPGIMGNFDVEDGLKRTPWFLFQVRDNKFELASRVNWEGEDIPYEGE